MFGATGRIVAIRGGKWLAEIAWPKLIQVPGEHAPCSLFAAVGGSRPLRQSQSRYAIVRTEQQEVPNERRVWRQTRRPGRVPEDGDGGGYPEVRGGDGRHEPASPGSGIRKEDA